MLWARLFALATPLAVMACDGEIRLVDRADTSSDVGGPDASPCTADLQCKVSALHCLVTAGECVQCTKDDHCKGSADGARCDLATHRCVECGVPTDCGDDSTCEPTTRKCVRTCVGGASECPSSAPRCDPARFLCVGCARDADCTSGDEHLCEVASGRCVHCLSDASCAGSSEPRCDLGTGKCVHCLSSADCGGHLCDPSKHECVEG